MVKTTNHIGESTAATMSSKRKKLEDDENSSISKKQRTRVSFSCGECHRRKQKAKTNTLSSRVLADPTTLLHSFSAIAKYLVLIASREKYPTFARRILRENLIMTSAQGWRG
ncbi:hypothetical protein PM082_005513 [Marasmius tenuissimus]|nr:hypothetical protein PM082_005513 [Marasmius tenuissimus]